MTSHPLAKLKLVSGAKGWFIKTADGCTLGGVNRFPETAQLAPICESFARMAIAAPKMLDLLTLALPYVEEGEEHNKPSGRKLSGEIRALIAKAGAS